MIHDLKKLENQLLNGSIKIAIVSWCLILTHKQFTELLNMGETII